LQCIYVEDRPDISRELPSWMFDAGYCGRMILGTPEVSVQGLDQLAALLATLVKTRKRGARSHPSRKEKDGATKPISESKTLVLE